MQTYVNTLEAAHGISKLEALAFLLLYLTLEKGTSKLPQLSKDKRKLICLFLKLIFWTLPAK
jgi:hypothetical protein